MHSHALRKAIPTSTKAIDTDFSVAVLRRLLELLAGLAQKG